MLDAARSVRGRWLPVLAILVCVCVLVPASRARAQGTSGLMPDPMSTAELLSYGDRLSLSPEQRRAAESMHDQYKAEFRILRDGDIADLMASMRTMQRAGMFPKKAEVEAFMKNMTTLVGKIAAVDDRLFDRLLPILSEDQIQHLPRARKARARRRLASARMLTMMTGGMPADLSELMLDVELSAEERQAIDLTVLQYENRLTSHMEKIFDQGSHFFLNLITAMEENGFTEDDWQNPEKAMEIQQAAQELMIAHVRAGMELSLKGHEHNRKTLQRLAPSLSSESMRSLRREFLARSYPEISQSMRWNRRPYVRALDRDDVAEGQKSEIRAILDRTDREMDEIAIAGMAVVDEYRGAQFMAMEDPEIWTKRQAEIGKVTKRATEAHMAALASLQGVLGEELAARLQVEATAEQHDKTKAAGLAMAAGGGGTELATTQGDSADIQEWGPDQFLPPQISEAHLRQYARILGLDDDRRAILSSMLDGYNEQYAPILTEIQSLQKAQQNVWKQDPDTGAYTADSSKVQHVYALRRKTLASIRAADNAYFDEVEEILFLGEPSPAMDRVRLTRERETWKRGAYSSFGMSGSNEANVDLMQVVRRLRFDEDTLAAIDPVLHDYEKKATPAFRTKYECSLTMQEANENWSAEVQKLQAAGTIRPEDYQDIYKRLMGEAQEALNGANARVAKLNREAVSGVATKLPAERAWRLEQDYRRTAFPKVYNDAAAVERHVRAAGSLDSLTAEQRRRLDELTAQYLPAYMAICEEMVELSSRNTGSPWMGGDSEGWIEFQERQERVAKLRFDREELNGRTNTRLREILSNDQIARMGGLPEIAVAEAKQWWD